MACLVQAVYTLEKDRTLSKMSLTPLAQDWWLHFNYKLVKTIHDNEKGGQIVGAVFKWSRRLSLLRPALAPKVVVAFRGTIAGGDTWQNDLKADLALMMLQLHKNPRYIAARRAIEQAVGQYGVEKVWIAGHSLGAAVCLLVGRTLAERKQFIEAHLFNLPLPSFVSEHVVLKSMHAVAATGLAAILHEEKPMKEASESFIALKNWHPHLYVNSHDPICSSYISYFKSLGSMLECDKSGPADFTAPNSLRAILRFGEAAAFHLIPSAQLHVVLTDSGQGFMKAHGMKQWWSQETQIWSQRVDFGIMHPVHM